ncbi:hypothetical protein [Blastococcus sp. VKM Ac-2987]|uniref:hypothetical protein n=1 Tax=Blastococcus sp. VKM Ac-2987 TaxID=3004141 RepID=UPI0022ABA7A0|nr:hypothetical protein [Blastococcus sp. VKM Ac-2987]MCZ2857050.1 hypothetical protein [Blastococcus sp. VKM Ac-2987]
MIVSAGLLVLLGAGLFVGGLITGITALYWGCVAACVVAAGVLVAARRAMGAGPAPAATDPTAPGDGAPAPAGLPAATGPDLATGATGARPPGEPPPVEPPRVEPPADRQRTAEPAAEPAADPAQGRTTPVREPAAGATAAPAAAAELPDPPVEEVEVTDLLVIVDLTDEVLVVDERPRYHVPGCVHLDGHSTIPLPLDEARTDGFTPCGVCRPDRTLAERARARRRSG